MTGRILLPSLRWLARLDRSYFFALAAFVVSLVVSVFLSAFPVIETVDGSTGSLIATEGAYVILLLALPVLVLGAPLISLPRTPGPRARNDKVNGVASTVVFVSFVVIFPSIGLYYLPALIFSAASTISLFFGRNRKPGAADAKQRGRSEDDGGMRLSRSARRRMRQQEQEAGEAGESPLQSSRRRRGRRRKR